MDSSALHTFVALRRFTMWVFTMTVILVANRVGSMEGGSTWEKGYARTSYYRPTPQATWPFPRIVRFPVSCPQQIKTMPSIVLTAASSSRLVVYPCTEFN
ncbi:uncharacterized protein C8Q71DRAFT_491203 [Rhodofomes roseus]|uniref:Secreted protein n=1 Tax=Rhodofomes roseus TaxID=34475 RepID=A0ABQ8KL47_9APHY|nr:uncharacterized protein C8Q71DRAFT_491203 [Rhodofomes roseus]KAH9839039.1 hypothetical protein C8Q71DRAFT_491203 [Rhodofomes roseus]